MKKLSITRITYDALLAAMCAVLGSVASLDFGTFKFTFENFPVLVAALLFGPIDGMLVGGIGIFLSQMLRYGVELSTPLWILPYIISGLFTGLWAKRFRYKGSMTIELVIVIVLNGIIVTAVNTVSLIIYYRYILGLPLASVFAAIPGRILTSVIKSVVFAFVLPPVIRALRRFSYRFGSSPFEY